MSQSARQITCVQTDHNKRVVCKQRVPDRELNGAPRSARHRCCKHQQSTDMRAKNGRKQIAPNTQMCVCVLCVRPRANTDLHGAANAGAHVHRQHRKNRRCARSRTNAKYAPRGQHRQNVETSVNDKRAGLPRITECARESCVISHAKCNPGNRKTSTNTRCTARVRAYRSRSASRACGAHRYVKRVG